MLYGTFIHFLFGRFPYFDNFANLTYLDVIEGMSNFTMADGAEGGGHKCLPGGGVGVKYIVFNWGGGVKTCMIVFFFVFFFIP